MPLFKIDDLKLWTGGEWFGLADKKPEIRAFSVDSRNMPPSAAFVALKAKRDGHDFIEDAVKNGAKAVIAERQVENCPVPVLVVKDTLKALQTVAKFHRLRFDSPVVGITGSCGKTSTKEFLAKLAAWKNPFASEKNFNNEIGVALSLTGIDLKQNQCAIIEAGVSKPGDMEVLAEMIEPDLCIVTNVGLAHLEGFKDIRAVAAEKAVLPEHAMQGGWCLIPHELTSWKAFETLACKKAVLAPVDAGDVKADLVFRYAIFNSENGAKSLELSIEGGNEYCFSLPELSDGTTMDLALAIAAALMLGTREEQIAARTEALSALPFRGSIVRTDTSAYYLDCYNASPTSMKDALAHFAKVCADFQDKLYVLGEMAELGLASLRHHKDIAKFVPFSETSRVCLVGGHSQDYKSGLIENGWPEDRIITVEGTEELSRIISNFDGAVFVKGSRVCRLEEALPPSVIDAANGISSPQAQEDEEADSALQAPAEPVITDLGERPDMEDDRKMDDEEAEDPEQHAQILPESDEFDDDQPENFETDSDDERENI